MNRYQRRAEEARHRKAASRDVTIRLALAALAAAGPTATGATVMLPDGELLYFSVETARAMTSNAPAGGRA